MIYSFTEKGDHLTVYKGKKKVHTPNGNVVIAHSEVMANAIVAELEAGKDHTSCDNMLCYHFTYCDLVAQYDRNTVANDFIVCVKDNIEADPLLMFRQGDKDCGDVVNSLTDAIVSHVGNCNMYQIVAMIVIYCSFDSLVLSWHIIDSLINTNADEQRIVAFIDDLKDFCKQDDLECPENIGDIIQAFTNYYNAS